VTADPKIHLINSGVVRPRGRGKIEQFFETITEVLLSRLPGYAPISGEAVDPRDQPAPQHRGSHISRAGPVDR
jgi:putative transposase